MEELFTILSSSARLDKRGKKRRRGQEQQQQQEEEEGGYLASSGTASRTRSATEEDEDDHEEGDHGEDYGEDDDDHEEEEDEESGSTKKSKLKSRDRTGKRDTSIIKRKQIHKEEIAAFRRSMSIRVSNKHDPTLPDPITTFSELQQIIPTWWSNSNNNNNKDDIGNHDYDTSAIAATTNTNNDDIYSNVSLSLQRNIENGKWKEPTPIQMQSIPILLQRRDLIGCSPTGSGKSGAFIIPSLLLASAPHTTFFPSNISMSGKKKKKNNNKKKTQQNDDDDDDGARNINRKEDVSRRGEIRSLLIAPARELAAQLHREVERLGMGKPGGLSSMLLSKSNSSHIIHGHAGGKKGLDVLVTTPLRLVDAIEKGLQLNSLRIIVLDEADRLLDGADGTSRSTRHNTSSNSSDEKKKMKKQREQQTSGSSDDDDEEDDDEDEEEDEEIPTDNENETDQTEQQKSGSAQTQSFLAQMDMILSAVPETAVRALFSATVTSTVKSLGDSLLRNPIDLKIATKGSYGGANTDIEQELLFVGREEGKLLAIRQLKDRGQLKPPCIMFLQSQERAQALFGELLYEGIHVDVIHAGRSRTARDNSIARFRKGETWVLICTDLVGRGLDFRAVNMVINYDLPTSGITYLHRIGRTGRAGRKGKAITFFTENDFHHLRTIANVMKQSGCNVDDWMLQLQQQKQQNKHQKQNQKGKNHNKNHNHRRNHRSNDIDTTSKYDKKKYQHKRQIIHQSKLQQQQEQKTNNNNKNRKQQQKK